MLVVSVMKDSLVKHTGMGKSPSAVPLCAVVAGDMLIVCYWM